MKQFSIGLLVVLAFGCSGEKSAPPAASSSAPASPAAPAVATSSPDGTQLVEVKVAADFTPSSFEVQSGKPVRISFVRGNEPSCGDEVVFKELDKRVKIPANATTVVDLTPQQSGSLNFTCGMNMMKGQIVVR